MKTKFYNFKNANALISTIFMCFALIYSEKIAAEQIAITILSGQQFAITLPSTICDDSGLELTHWVPGEPSQFSMEVTAADLNPDPGTYHLAQAGVADTLIVDIPTGAEFANTTGMFYKYSFLGENETGSFVQFSTAGAPPGFMRAILPYNFEHAGQKAYMKLMFYSEYGANGTNYMVTVPFTVLGRTHIGAPVAVIDTITEPQLPYLILHAPPGDASSSEFQSNKTTCRSFETTVEQDISNSVNLAVKLGVAGEAGIFVTTEFEFSVTLSAGLTAGNMQVVTTDNQTCVTVSQGFATDALAGAEGEGDVFIGYGTDLVIGMDEVLTVPPGACAAAVDTVMVYAPVGLPRKFIYTKDAIEADIENLQTIVADSAIYPPKSTNNAQNQIDVWNEVLAMNTANIDNPNNELIEPISFSGSTTSYNESSISVSETNTINYQSYIDVSAGLEAVVEVGGSGVSGGYEFNGSKRYGQTQNQSVEGSKLVKYTLHDDDPGDIFNLMVVRDPMFGTPIFKIGAGTESSCPYQGGYQLDQPKLTFADGSDHLTLDNIPEGTTATFPIKICNDSNEDRDYFLKGNPSSNLDGAVVEGFGNNLFSTNDNGVEFLNVPAGGCLADATVSIHQPNMSSITDYENLELKLYPLCEGSNGPITSSIFLNAHFTGPNGISEIEKDSRKMVIAPNPNEGRFTIRFEDGARAGELRITDLAGKAVFRKTLIAGQTTLKINKVNFAPGVYILTAQYGSELLTKKLIIN